MKLGHQREREREEQVFEEKKDGRIENYKK